MKVERKHVFAICGVFIAVFHVLLFIPFIPVVESSPSQIYNLDPDDRPATYEVVSAERVETWSPAKGDYIKPEITLNNTDSYGGVFKVSFSFFNQTLNEKTGSPHHLEEGSDVLYEFLDWKRYHGDGIIGVINLDGGVPILIPTVDHVTREIYVKSGETWDFTATFDVPSDQEVYCGYTISPPRIKTIYKSILELLLTG